MAITYISGAVSADAETPLLDDTVDGSVDYKGSPVQRSNSGGWRSASFIIGVEIAERFAYYGIGSNLITYLTGPLGQSTATAAANVNTWSGTASLLPLLGAFIADSFLGRYRTIVIASLIYILGLALLTLSTILPTFVVTPDCQVINKMFSCTPQLQIMLFFFSLYLVALGQGGHKPCVQAFGADQFDAQDPDESKAKSSFFNWWYFSICGGGLVSLLILNYIQDNLNWGLGFGIPCISMAVALLVFWLGTRTYRYSIKGEEESAFMRIGRVFVAAVRNWKTTPSAISAQEEACGTLPNQTWEQFKSCNWDALMGRFLNKALLAPDGSKEFQKVCSIHEVEEAKQVLRLVPIWATCLVYGLVFAQSSTFFTKQGFTMDRSITPGFDLPAATLQSFISIPIVLVIPIYDRIIVPIARSFTGEPAGITMLQRIGIGMLLSVISMVIAALVEMKRLKIAEEYGLIDKPNVTVPMSVWMLLPQYLLFGVADVFTMVGLQEFFYDQVPNELRSVGLSLYLSIFGVGSFLSSFLVSAIEKATGGDGRYSWFANNLNRAHLDYFYWLLAGLTIESHNVVDSKVIDLKGFMIWYERLGHPGKDFCINSFEIAERFAYYRIRSNLITYLTPLGQFAPTAAANFNSWSGTASLMPLLGALFAYSFLGRYRTIIIASLIYIMGLALLTLSTILSLIVTPDCQIINQIFSCSPQLQKIFFFFSLYLIALGQGGHRPGVQAFRVDQLNAQDPDESKAKRSFFNRWYFIICAGGLGSLLILNYIQEYLNW
ncbi:LOW QUALITY PROTEIN: PTR2 domain-containing protein, partial [Cephalotus follicularis]